MNNRVFVYGTLKQNFVNHRVMERAGGEYQGEAETPPGYMMYGDGIPFVRTDDSNRTVKGEVYDVEDTDPIDALEGHPYMYCREQRYIPGFGMCWIYLVDHWRDNIPQHDVIENGVF